MPHSTHSRGRTRNRPARDDAAPDATINNRLATSTPAEQPDERETPGWTVIAAILLVSIPLALCCYLLLKL